MATFQECLKTEIDYYQPQPVQLSILRNETIKYSCSTNLESSDILEFNINGGGDSYKDLHSASLHLKLQILKDTKLAYLEAETDQPTLCNNFMNSIFKTLTVQLNNVPVSVSLEHPYKSIIENTLSYGVDASSTQLNLAGFYVDKGELEGLTGNDGLTSRKALFKNSAIVEVLGPIDSEVCQQGKLLPSGVDIKIQFTLNRKEFFMMSKKSNTPILKIIDANIFIKSVYLNPQLLLAQEKMLLSRNAIFPIKRNIVKSFTVSPLSTVISIDNISNGQLPRTVLIAFVKNTSYNGEFEQNPFNFEHFDMSSIALHINGSPVNTKIEMNFDHNHTALGYNTLLQSLNLMRSYNNHVVSQEMWRAGYAIFGWDLTPDSSSGSMATACRNIANDGTIRMDATFSEALTSSLTCIAYLSFDSEFEITKDRQIITRY